MYNMSLFANGVIFATDDPEVAATEVKFVEDEAEVGVGNKVTLHVVTKPFTANPTLTYTSSSSEIATVGSQTGKYIEITGVGGGTATITVTDGTHSDTASVVVPTEPATETPTEA